MEFNLVSVVEGGEFVVLDVEGDGESGQHPVEISILRYRAGRPVEEYHWLVNPQRPISAIVTSIHGITNQMVARAPTFDMIHDDIAELLRDAVVVAHNIKDDMRLLDPVMPEARLLPAFMVDSYKVARNLVRETARHNLGSLSEALGIELPEAKPYPVRTSFPGRGASRHSTGGDTYLTGEAMLKMVGRLTLGEKQVKHVSHASLFIMNPRQRQELVDRIEADNRPASVGSVAPGV